MRPRSVLLWLVLGAACLSSSALLRAQRAAPVEKPTVRINSIKSEFLRLPQSAREVEAANEGLSQEWFRVEVEFSVDAELIPELTAEFFVEAYAKNPETGAWELVVLSGEQRYLNVAKDRRHYAAMWMHPGAVRRFSLDDRPDNLTKGNVRVVLKPAGGAEVMEEKNKGVPPDWTKLGRSISGVLIGLMDSPFWPASARRYNQVVH